MNDVVVSRLSKLAESDVAQLADVLVDCVEGGASVSFMIPLSHARAAQFWRRVAGDVEGGKRILLVASDTTGIVGTVQVIVDQPENQPHRADVAKMLVHRRARRRGIAQRLMEALDVEARREGKTVLVLDTVTGGDAERLYTRLAWQRCGVIPDYALWPNGGLCATTVFFKRVAHQPPA